MNKIGLLLCSMLAAAAPVSAQMHESIRLNEVMTNNTASLQDEYGHCGAWIEIANISHTTYNIRGMYITTDRSVLDKDMSVPERIKRMSVIPSGDERTNLTARQHLVFYLNSNPARGVLHLNAPVDSLSAVWFALYDGNGVDLVDSVTVPVMAANHSFARQTDGVGEWEEKPEDAVTPNISNYITIRESKIAKLKREDPHGYGITVLAMGIVFFCLALLFVFFYLFGLFMRKRHAMAKIQPLKMGVKTVEKTVEIGHKTGVVLQDGLKSKGIDKEIYIAVIAMALKQYQDDVHDVESGVITIKHHQTEWNSEYNQIKQFHD
ncbi:MAG: OadG family protein [Prevotella sp.]|nr:OadG family protein [Prevotella sp.]